MKNITNLLMIFLFPMLLSSQSIVWENVSTAYQFPDGLSLYHGTISGNATFLAYYYEVDLSVPTIAVRPYLKTTPTQVNTFTAQVGAYGAVNGGYFAGTSSVSSVIYPNEVLTRNITSVVRNSKTYPLIRPVFALNTDRTPVTRWVYHHSYQMNDIYCYDQPLQYICDDPNPLPVPLKANGYQWDNVAYGLGGGPQLIKNGVVNITYCEEVFWGSGVYITDYRPRTAVGYTNDNKVIMFVTNNMTITEVAQTMLSIGCYEAINLDGGGSSAISAGGQSLYDQNRAVPTILAVVHADSLNIPPAIVFEKTIDTGDPGVTSLGNWFPTANPGSWGNPSMLHGLATHDQYYEFPLNLPAAGEYQVYSWWTASSNRSTTTPYFINHTGGVSQVAVNQTIGGSMWNLIGTWNFSGNADDKVRITAGATTNQYVVADGIRIVSYDTQLDLNRIVFIEPVNEIHVPLGTPKAQALAMLSSQTNITTTHNLTYAVNLNWESAQYNSNVPGSYQADGTFTLPAGVYQSSPPMQLLVQTNIIVDDNTGISGSEKMGIRLFPNPNQGSFVIEGDNQGIVLFELISPDGKNVFEGRVCGSFRERIDLAGVSRGVYILRIKSEQMNAHLKIIIH